ncbi:MAG: hypothetical protein GY795_35795 [Desulfobacterales bacterium]|nr:hypothetical protein [Desulfobacterales bacterium]
MKVRFSEDVLNDPDAWPALDRIVYHFLERRHEWDIDDIDEIEQSRWIQSDIGGRAGKHALDELQKCCTESIYPRQTSRMHSIAITVTKHNTSVHRLVPDEARRCLDAPAYVAVENAESDGAFIKAMIHGLNRELLLDAHTEGWWDFKHLGGSGETEKRINQIIARSVGPLRVFVLSDSDRLYPGHISLTMQIIERCCQKHNIPYAFLNKREIENYLSVNIIQKLPSNFKRTIQAFLKLTQEQKDFYDMKSGFKKDEKRNWKIENYLPAYILKKIPLYVQKIIVKGLKKDKTRNQAIVPDVQKELFKHVRQNILSDLCGGFGRDIWQYFNKHDSITKDDIRATCPAYPDEIDRILDNIESLL